MSDYKPSGAWASEAFDFLVLTQRFMNRIWGLLLLEIGWGAVLLIPKQLSDPNVAPSLSIPSGLSLSPLSITYFKVELSTVYVFGAILIALTWFLFSGLIILFYLPTKKFIRIALIFVLFTLLLPFSLLFRIARRIVNFLKMLFGAAQTPDLNSGNYEHPNSLNVALRYFLFQLFLNVEIALVPFFFGSYIEEEIRIAKTPTQLFSGIIGHIKSKLQNLRSVQSVTYRLLPSLSRTNTPDTLYFAKRLLGIDIVIWGSYVRLNPPEIWINLEAQRNYFSSNLASQKTDSTDPFEVSEELNITSFVIHQDDVIDTYSVILISLLAGMKLQRGFLYKLLSFLGMKVDVAEEEDALIYHLISNVLFKIDKPVETNDIYPTAKYLLVKLASEWFARRMTSKSLFTRNNQESYKEVMLKCIELNPNEANHYYRLAVVECISGNEIKAKDNLEKGLKFDRGIKWAAWDYRTGERLVNLTSRDFSEDSTGIQIAQRIINLIRLLNSDTLKTNAKSSFVNSEYYRNLQEGKSTIYKQHKASMQLLFDQLEIETAGIRFE